MQKLIEFELYPSPQARLESPLTNLSAGICV